MVWPRVPHLSSRIQGTLGYLEKYVERCHEDANLFALHRLFLYMRTANPVYLNSWEAEDQLQIQQAFTTICGEEFTARQTDLPLIRQICDHITPYLIEISGYLLTSLQAGEIMSRVQEHLNKYSVDLFGFRLSEQIKIADPAATTGATLEAFIDLPQLFTTIVPQAFAHMEIPQGTSHRQVTVYYARNCTAAVKTDWYFYPVIEILLRAQRAGLSESERTLAGGAKYLKSSVVIIRIQPQGKPSTDLSKPFLWEIDSMRRYVLLRSRAPFLSQANPALSKEWEGVELLRASTRDYRATDAVARILGEKMRAHVRPERILYPLPPSTTTRTRVGLITEYLGEDLISPTSRRIFADNPTQMCTLLGQAFISTAARNNYLLFDVKLDNILLKRDIETGAWVINFIDFSDRQMTPLYVPDRLAREMCPGVFLGKLPAALATLIKSPINDFGCRKLMVWALIISVERLIDEGSELARQCSIRLLEQLSAAPMIEADVRISARPSLPHALRDLRVVTAFNASEDRVSSAIAATPRATPPPSPAGSGSVRMSPLISPVASATRVSPLSSPAGPPGSALGRLPVFATSTSSGSLAVASATSSLDSPHAQFVKIVQEVLGILNTMPVDAMILTIARPPRR